MSVIPSTQSDRDCDPEEFERKHSEGAGDDGRDHVAHHPTRVAGQFPAAFEGESCQM